MIKGLARTADLARQDADHLDAETAALQDRLGGAPWPVEELTGVPIAIRTRWWRGALAAQGAVIADLSSTHVASLETCSPVGAGKDPWTSPDGFGCDEAPGRSTSSPAVRLNRPMDSAHLGDDLDHVLYTQEQIHARLEELGKEIWADYHDKEVLLVGVLKGAVLVMADLMRALPGTVTMDWMAVSSYGSGTKSSGVVRILKDLDTDISNRHVLIVEDIIDSGLTLNWIRSNLLSRNPASLEICTLLRKPEAAKVEIDCKYVGFEIPNEFVVGYGLDFDEKYRNLRDIGVLAPHMYS